LSDGKRRVVSISEVTGIEGDVIQMQELFKFNRVSTNEDGEIQGHFQATGIRPKFLPDLAARGLTVPASYFDPTRQL
jgi:pilus assembly protein CpaF